MLFFSPGYQSFCTLKRLKDFRLNFPDFRSLLFDFRCCLLLLCITEFF